MAGFLDNIRENATDEEKIFYAASLSVIFAIFASVFWVKMNYSLSDFLQVKITYQPAQRQEASVKSLSNTFYELRSQSDKEGGSNESKSDNENKKIEPLRIGL